MGKHKASRKRAAGRRVDRDRRVLVGLVAAAVGANVVLAVAADAALPGFNLFPQEAETTLQKGRPAAAPGGPALPAKPAAPAPAETVITKAVATAAKSLAAPGWRAEKPSARIEGAPFNYMCEGGFAGPARPVFGQSVGAVRPGAGPTSAQGLHVQVWAYGAGEGAAAVAAFREELRDCRSRDGLDVRVGRGPGLGEGGLVASELHGGGGTVWMLWRRGDVLTSIAATASNAGPEMVRAREVAGEIDALLARELEATCADQAGSVEDASRNPFADRDRYRPYGRDETIEAPEVPLPAPLPLPTQPPVEIAPRPYRTLPAFPGLVDPEGIAPPRPLVTSYPDEPEPPAEAPRSATVRILAADEVGPGCGWVFTRQAAPLFDAAEAQRQVEELSTAARAELARGILAELEAQQRYQQELAVFEYNLEAWRAWRTWRNEVEEARTELAAALAPPPSPEPTVSPTPTASPSPTSSPSPTVSPTPTGSPTPTASPSPTRSPVLPPPSSSASPSETPSASPSPPQSE